MGLDWQTGSGLRLNGRAALGEHVHPNSFAFLGRPFVVAACAFRRRFGSASRFVPPARELTLCGGAGSES